MGQKYAINHLICFLGVVAQKLTWTRTRTPVSDEVDYLPTLYPKDCIMALTPA